MINKAESRVNDPVHHPAHYNAHPSGVECITIVEHMSFNIGSAMKYLWRADEKGRPLEDLEKAKWFIDREIARRKVVGEHPSAPPPPPPPSETVERSKVERRETS